MVLFRTALDNALGDDLFWLIDVFAGSRIEGRLRCALSVFALRLQWRGGDHVTVLFFSGMLVVCGVVQGGFKKLLGIITAILTKHRCNYF